MERKKLLLQQYPLDLGEPSIEPRPAAVHTDKNGAAVLMSAWCSTLPPCSGYWDVDLGDGSVERLWFEKHQFDGIWKAPVTQKILGRWVTYQRTLKWRGLKAPEPNGYRYEVPWAPTFRNRIQFNAEAA